MSNKVNEFMAGLEHPLKPEIEALRAIILGADKRIQESIKWNAPSFYIDEHFATFKLHPTQTIQVVFHRGAKAKDNSAEMKIGDPSGLLKWAASDRGVATFSSMSDIQAKKAALVDIVQRWINNL